MSTDPTSDPVQLARAGTEAIRCLGHHLSGTRLDAGQVYDVLAELTVLASRYPHLLARLDAALTAAADDGHLVAIDDAGRRHDPTDTLAAISEQLTAAKQNAHALTEAVDAAHEHTAYLARRNA